MIGKLAQAPSPQRARRLRAARTLGDAASGVIVASIAMTVAVSVGALVFGAAAPELETRGIGLALASCAVAMAVVALYGSQREAVACTQDTPAAVLAGAASAVASGVALAPGTQEGFATVAAMVGITTVATGLVFVTVGWLRLGALVRFLPYPVMGGFLAGTGWLLLLGGVSVMSGRNVELSNVGEAVGADWLYTVLPGLALAGVLVVLSRRSRSPLTYPAAVAAAVAAFYLAMAASGSGLAVWRDAGLLLSGASGREMLLPLRPSHLAAVDWGVIAGQAPALAAVALLALIATLLNVTASGLATGKRVDLDRQLRAAGLANLVSGSFGGMVGYQSVSLSELNRRAGTGSRFSVLVGAAVVLAALLMGGSLVGYLPRPVVGGVVSFLGLGFLYDWLWRERRRLGGLEYAIVLVILLVIALVGFLEGVALGLVLTVLLFVVNYSRIDPVRYAASGAHLASRVRRSPPEAAALAAAGDGLLVLQLQGFLFFGTTARVLERVESAWRERPLDTVVLDLGRATGIDASGMMALRTLQARSATNGSRVWLAEVPGEVAAALQRAGMADEGLRVFPTVDAALEARERETLDSAGVRPSEAGTLEAALAGSSVPASALEPYLRRVELETGQRLFAQGDDARTLYLVAAGRVTSLRERTGAEPERLETMGPGHAVGEVGILTGAARGATVTADERSVVYCLTAEALEELARVDPRAAASVYEWLARRMAGRIGHLVSTVDALRR